jgi:hypothetical protein
MKDDTLAFVRATQLVVDNAGEQRKSIEEVYRLIQKHCQEFKPEQRQAMIAAQQDCKWDRPPLGYVKVNLYASFITENRDGAYGYVIPSDTSDFIAAGAGKLPHLRSALHGEAEACLAAIEATANLGIFRVQFESDSTTLVSAIKNGGYDLSDIGMLLREACSLSILHFDHAVFVSCRPNM